MTTWVEMYHPALPGSPHIRAATQAVDEYAARGWIVVDGSTPVPSNQFLTPFAGDLRYLKVWTPNEVLTAGAVRIAPDGHVITRNGNGTARGSYDTTEQAAWTVIGGGSSGQPLQQIATTVSASGALVSNKHNPVNATGGAKAMTLPTGQAEGATISVEKSDASTNAVTVTGNIRGVGSTSITLVWQNEDLVLRADAAGSWWPVAGHKTKATLDQAYTHADPVLSNFSYDATTGNLLSYQEDGITITLTYNADGTVATSQRGTATAKTYSYTSGNLVGVA